MGKKKWKSGMSKKILIGIGIAAVIIALLVGIYFIQVYKPAIQEKKQLIERFSGFEIQYQEKKAQGYDVSEARVFARKAKRAFDSKDYKMANNLLDNAFEALEKAEKILIIPEAVKEEARERLSDVRVATFYKTVTDGKLLNRSYGDVVNIIGGVKTDLIFHAFECWRTCPEHCEDIASAPKEWLKEKDIQELINKCEESGYSYTKFQNANTELKAKLPDVIISTAILWQFLNPHGRNPITGEFLMRDDTWEMALDPSKWGIPVTKEKFQTEWAKSAGWIEIEPSYPKEQLPFYFPDVTNPDFQELFLSHAKRPIDAGADAIWIDMLYRPANLLAQLSEDPTHISVQESSEAISKIVDEIHKYGLSKGRWVYVGSWGLSEEFPFPLADLDFVTLTISPEEILNGRMNKGVWDEKLDKVRKQHSNAQIFVFFDYGFDNSPMETFSQRLTSEKQKEFLKYADEFFAERGVILVYPVHGGSMGKNPKVLSFGKYEGYDSLVHEFQTYETIKELAEEKAW